MKQFTDLLYRIMCGHQQILSVDYFLPIDIIPDRNAAFCFEFLAEVILGISDLGRQFFQAYFLGNMELNIITALLYLKGNSILQLAVVNPSDEVFLHGKADCCDFLQG